MLIGQVIGSLWATRKDEKLNGLKLMVVKPMYSRDSGYIVAADNAGAGVQDVVLITKGSAARVSIEGKEVPIDAVIVGVVDSIDIEMEDSQ